MRKQMPEKRDYVSSFEWLVLYLNIKSTRGEIPLATDKCSWLNLLRKEEFPLWGRMCGIRMATDKILTRQQRLLSVLRHRLFFLLFPAIFPEAIFAGFFIALSGAHYWFLASPANFFRMTATLDMQYDIPNFRKIRSLTRDRVQMAPG